jgi:hypothetical protein
VLVTIDTGLATCGVAVFDDAGQLVDADVFTSAPRPRPNDFSGAWEGIDCARRGRGLASWLMELRKRWRQAGRTVRIMAEAVVTARQAHTLALQMCSTGVVVMFGLTWGHVEWSTPLEWRAKLGWFPSDTRGMSKRQKTITKKRDDDHLYAMLAKLRDAERLVQLVLAHGRKPGDVVHAWDAFGLGRATLGILA